MKKLIYTIGTLLLISTSSCNNNTDDYNNDKAKTYEVSPEALLTNAEKELTDQMTTPSVNLNPFRFLSQYWAETTYNDESRYKFITRSVTDNHWNALYRGVLGNLKSAQNYIDAETQPNGITANAWAIQQNNKKAIIEVLQVYTFQILVDSFGDIPYTDASDPSILLPKYDNDTDIYPKLITRLDNAISNMNTSGSSFAKGEYVYNGDVTKWKQFANSLKIKIGINLADINPSLSKTTVESGFIGGAILNNSQNATFNYPTSAPNYNPLFAELIASGRNDFVAANTIVNAMNLLNDPRRTVYFNQVGGTYIGGIYGAANNNYVAFSQIGDKFRVANLPAELFEATEINFYLAEAAARGYSVGNTPIYYYNSAINASFEYWGISSQAVTYLANPSVNYLTATGTWQQKIGTQAWLAFFNRGFESWNSYRRLDYPVLIAPSNASSAADGQVPKRLTYPIIERTVNTTSYQEAVAAIGGLDRLKVHVFWDVN